MNKSKKNIKKGGKIIASGGFGCVFSPALKCHGTTKRESGKISKIMINKHAAAEYEEINSIKKKLDSIPNYEDYFLLNDVTLCHPAKLTNSDLEGFSDKCKTLIKRDITKKNINTKLDEITSLNLPNGGLPVDDFLYKNGSFEKMYKVHVQLLDLLKNGIIPMNSKNIYHSDIKDSNVLIDESGKVRLIDWGLTVDYQGSKTSEFPKNWRNRPLQFNVPFSVIIFTDSFYEKYSEYLKNDGKVEAENLRPFVVDYLNSWMKERGSGHYKFINEIMYMLYSNIFTSVSEKRRPVMIETEITIPIITNYIIDVLLHYTKFKENGSLNLREYLNNVYIEIVDIWGFINVYYPILELLYNNYFSLKEEELQIFKKIEFIFNEYMYNPRHEPIERDKLLKDLDELTSFFYTAAYGNKKISKKTSHNLASGILKNKTRRKNNLKLFKRKKLIKKFKTPFFLSLK
jgi:serine/threonine protein kinase